MGSTGIPAGSAFQVCHCVAVDLGPEPSGWLIKQLGNPSLLNLECLSRWIGVESVATAFNLPVMIRVTKSFSCDIFGIVPKLKMIQIIKLKLI